MITSLDSTKRLKRVSKKAGLTVRKRDGRKHDFKSCCPLPVALRDLKSRCPRWSAFRTGKLSKGFARGLYRKANNINREIGQKVSARLIKIAKQYGVKYIVFEYLKGWRPRGGKRKSTLRQRFHGWLHRRIVDLTQMKWNEQGGQVKFVYARGTSSNAFDGSGKVKRSKTSYELAVFSSGKQYNCDLSASYNIGARFIYKLCGGNSPEDLQGKSSCKSLRSPVTLSILWRLPPSNIVEQDTQPSRQQG